MNHINKSRELSMVKHISVLKKENGFKRFARLATMLGLCLVLVFVFVGCERSLFDRFMSHL